MCSHYQALKEREKFLKVFGVEPPLEDGKLDVWPGYLGVFIRKHPNADVGDAAVPHAEALNGQLPAGQLSKASQETRVIGAVGTQYPCG